METDARDSRKVPHPALVGTAAWLLPGAGYWLLGHRARGATVGLTIVLVFVIGLFVGGVRVLEVPTYGHLGESNNGEFVAEVRSKPWSIAQVMVGPIAIAAGALSVSVSRPDPALPLVDPDRAYDSKTNPNQSHGSDSHSRTNEIAVLYTAVAGMLNLLVIIDSSHRAGRAQEGA